MKIITTVNFDDTKTWDEFRDFLSEKDIKIADNECYVLHCTKHRTVILSNMNRRGGVCDDCVGDIESLKINSYDIVRF